jgi:hypothetical protein
LPGQRKPDSNQNRREEPAHRSHHSVRNGGLFHCVLALGPPHALQISFGIQIARSKIALVILVIGH